MLVLVDSVGAPPGHTLAQAKRRHACYTIPTGKQKRIDNKAGPPCAGNCAAGA